MKKRILFVSMAIAISFAACKKETKKNDIPDPNPGVVPFDSTVNVSQNKASLETSGVEFTQEIGTFKDEKAFGVISHFSDLMGSQNSGSGLKSTRVPGHVSKVLYALKGVKSNNSSLVSVLSTLKSTSQADPTTLSEAWDQAKGLYLWNAAKNGFDDPTASDKIEFRFPASATSSTNNASFTVYSYKGFQPSEPIDGYAGDIPANVSADLKVDGSTVLSYSYEASYTAKGVPQLVTSSLSLGAFKFTVTLKNLDTQVGYRYLFEHDSKTLFDMVAEANGNFKDITNSQTDDPTTILKSANAYVQILNVRIAGNVDFETFYHGMNSITDNQLLADSLKAIQMTNEINKDIKMFVYFVDTKKKIADMQAVVYMDTYEEWEWNNITNKYELVTKSQPNVDMQFIFADGSKMDSETFFKTGFTQVITEMNKVMAQLNDKYGTDTKPIEY